MIDMRHPARRATQCLSCHLGDFGEGKFVTHEMYAAGHPPLSGFEVETFLRAMPPHWKPLAEKSEAVRAQLNYDPARLDAANSTLLAGLLAQRCNVELFAAQTTAAAAAAPPSWPDFAAFDCYACHHDLKSPPWRQQRGYQGQPGRPPMHSWPAAFVEASLSQSTTENAAAPLLQQYEEQLTKFGAAVAARPFGDAAAIGDPGDANSASGALLQLLDVQIAQLYDAQLDRESVLTAMRSLCGSRGDGAAPLRDYPSARQVAWALSSMYRQLDPKPENHAAIENLLQELDRGMRLSLPNESSSGAKAEISSAGAVEQAMPQFFQVMSQYDPQWFNEQLAALREML